MENFECCFCGQKIKSNIVALLLTTNWEQNDDQQQSQQLFCHLSCFKETMNNRDVLYVENMEI